MAVNLILRFDESLLTGNRAPSPKTAVELADGAGGPLGPASARADMLAGAKDRLSYVLALVPRQATVELPSYRQAPKFSLTFAFRDFPIDPRAIRAASVEVYLGTVAASDWARGMRGAVDGGRLASQLVQSPESLMLVGLVNSISSSHTEKGSEVRMEGMGLQSLFLSLNVAAETFSAITSDRPVNEVVAQVLEKVGLSKKVPVRVQSEDWPSGVLPPVPREVLTRSSLGATGKKPQLGMKGDPNATKAWDVITNLCYLVGAIPYFIGHELWIRPTRSIFTQKNAGITRDTPFRGGRPRTIRGPNNKSVDISFRKMVYGRNLLNFTLERKFFTEGTLPTLRIVSVDTSSKEKGARRRLEVFYPPEAEKEARASFVAPSGSDSTTNVITLSVPGIKDKVRLQEIARQVYEEVARGELGGSFSSKDLASLGGDNEDADILRLRPGDAVEFVVDGAGLQSLPPVVSELSAEAAKSVQEAVEAVAARLGGRRDLAEVLVGTARGRFQGLQNIFRVATVRYAWEVGTGISVDADFQNYVTARSDVEGSTDVSELGDFPTAFMSTNERTG